MVTKHLLHIFPSFEVGGAQARTAAWINRLGDRYRHTIVAISGDTSAQSLLHPSVESEIVTGEAESAQLLTRLKSHRSFLRASQPDVLITNNWGSIEWALANRLVPVCPGVHVESGFGTDEAAGPIFRRVLVRRIALSGQVRVIVPSHSLVRIVCDAWGLDAKRVLHIPDGIDCALFSDADPLDLAAYSLPPDNVVVGTVAALRAEKSLQVLIDAVALARKQHPIVLVIVGEGAQRSVLEDYVKRAGLQDSVYFTGFVSAVEKTYPCFDIFGMSSVTEQMPNAVLQAMAAALPIVSTDVGDVSGMLGVANQLYLVPVDDVALMAENIVSLARDANLRHRVGLENRRMVFENHDVAAMVRAYDELFVDVMSDSVSERVQRS